MRKLITAWLVLLSVVPATAGQHDYFESLVSRSDFWKGFSLRPRTGEPKTSPYYENTYGRPKDGGYQSSNNSKIYVTHDAVAEAAKVVIPAWSNGGDEDWALKVNLNATETHVVPRVPAGFVDGKVIKLDNEVMLITAIDDKDPATDTREGFTVLRGQFGTTAAPHIAGTPLYTNTNSLPHQLRFPIATQDGHTYLFTWDALFTSSYIGTELQGNKTFQFTSGGDAIWFEVKTMMQGGTQDTIRTDFDPLIHVGGIAVRSYLQTGGGPDWSLTDGNKLGPGMTDNNSLLPMTGTMNIYPNRWTRYWMRIDQRADDYDYIDLWVADSIQGPVHLFTRVPDSVRPGNSIDKFWLEFNDSQARLAAGRAPEFEDMVAFVRNIAVLIDPPSDISSLLVRPAAGGVPPPPVPSAPTIVTHPANRSVSAGTNALFSVIYTGHPMPTFQWESKAPTASSFTPILGAKGPTYTLAAQLSHSGTQFQCVVMNSLGKVTSNPATLTVSPAGTPPPPPPPPPPGTGNLPTPDLSSFNGGAFTIRDEIVLRYSNSAARFNWEVAPRSVSAPSAQARVSGGAPINTESPRFSLASQQLAPGPYTLRVQAVSGSQMSAWASASITLVGADLSQVRVYPNPWRSDRHPTRSITFDQLTVNTKIKIFTISGHFVKALPPSSTSAVWDLTNDKGDRVASGTYLYLMTTDAGGKKTGQVVVIR